MACAICGLAAHELTSHITRTHKMTVGAYRLQYSTSRTHSQKYLAASSTRIKGANNPAYQHGGRLSPFSEKFIHYTPGLKARTTEKAKQSKFDNNNVPTALAYWLKQTGGNVEDAEILLKDRQSTFSLDKCIKKLGKDAGTARWVDRQTKWQTNYKKSNFSKISQQLFWSVFFQYDNQDVCHFASLGNQHNNELTLKLSNRTIKPDFIDVARRRIIEFDGDYWHGKRYNSEREESRDRDIIADNYEILHIAEHDYKQDPQKVISECLSFLTA